jgi:hypothetical protein
VIKVNGKRVSQKKAQEIIDDKNKIVTSLTMSFDKPKKKKRDPLTHEGFEIPQEFISELSKTMDRTNAKIAALSVERSSKIRGRNFYMIVLDDDSPWNIVLNEVIKHG